MDIRKILQEQKKAILLATKYWIPIIKDAFYSSLTWWVTALGLVFIATLVSMVITYKIDGEIMVESFFPPNFGRGVLIVALAIFIYQLFIETGKHINNYRTKANKHTWDDVTIKGEVFPKESRYVYGIKVINTKPYKITNISLIPFYLDINRNPINIGSEINGIEPQLLSLNGNGVEKGYYPVPIDENGGEVIFLLLDIENGSYRFLYKKMVKLDPPVDGKKADWVICSHNLDVGQSHTIRGMFRAICIISDHQLNEEEEYSFVITINGENIVGKLEKGRFDDLKSRKRTQQF
jgi:hypothetical protein